MQSNFQMLRNFDFNPKERGILEGDEVKLIRKQLQIAERSDIELQNLRDFVVLYYSTVKRDKDLDEEMRLMDIMSGITAVIDSEKFERKMEV